LTTLAPSQVLADVIGIIEGLSGEWEYSGEVSPETRMFADMALKSLDFAILSSEVVKKYGLVPFDVFYAEITEVPPEEREVTISEYVDFICRHLPS